jgi:hypothetical protein
MVEGACDLVGETEGACDLVGEAEGACVSMEEAEGAVGRGAVGAVAVGVVDRAVAGVGPFVGGRPLTGAGLGVGVGPVVGSGCGNMVCVIASVLGPGVLGLGFQPGFGACRSRSLLTGRPDPRETPPRCGRRRQATGPDSQDAPGDIKTFSE